MLPRPETVFTLKSGCSCMLQSYAGQSRHKRAGLADADCPQGARGWRVGVGALLARMCGTPAMA